MKPEKSPRLVSLIFLTAVIWLAACTPGGVQPPPATTLPPGSTPLPTPTPLKPLETARLAVAHQLGVALKSVEMQSEAEVNWPDSCLGVAFSDEVCAQVVTPGYVGMLVVDGQQFEYHRDLSGKQVRLIPSAALLARQLLTQQLSVFLDTIHFLNLESVVWPDACLGVASEGVACAQVETPGYRVVLSVQGERYEYHTDDAGAQIVLAAAPPPQLGQQLVTWSHMEGGRCQTALIGSLGVAFGPCGGVLMPGRLVEERRAEDAAEFAGKFAPFEAETPAGKVSFQGLGPVTATPAQQRMIAEWARLVTQEAWAGRSGASWGLAIGWHREGGVAGFCDDVTIHVTGEAIASTCQGDEPRNLGRVRLTSGQLQAMYGWIDTWQNFELEQVDPAKADSLTVRMVFAGTGNLAAGEGDQQAMQELAQELLAQLSLHPDPQALAAARAALVNYFAALHEGRYTDAAALYGGGYELLSGFNPELDPEDHPALLRSACTINGYLCLPVRNLVSEAQHSGSEFRFTVEFLNPDGNLFSLGPCCGADPDELPPQTQFDYSVVRRGRDYRVQELPVYIP